MSATALMLITLSALLQASYSALVKKSRNKTVFLWWMVFISSMLLTGYVVFSPDGPPPPNPQVMLLGAIGGMMFVLYHLCTGRAYNDGDLSVVYPLSQTAILWAPVWGVILFHESVSLAGMIGVMLIVFGAYCAQMEQISLGGLVKPLGRMNEPGVRWALLAGLIYSFGSIVDKIGVGVYPAFWFSYLLILFMCLFMTLNVLRKPYREHILPEWRGNWRSVLIAGTIMIGSFVAFRFALQLSSISYAVPVRQISVVIAVLIGIMILREPCGRIRLMSASLILGGITLIKLF